MPRCRACGGDLCAAVALSVTPQHLHIANDLQALASLAGWFSRTWHVVPESSQVPVELPPASEVVTIDSDSSTGEEHLHVAGSTVPTIPDGVGGDLLECLRTKQGSSGSVVQSFVAIARSIGWRVRLVLWLKPMSRRLPPTGTKRYGRSPRLQPSNDPYFLSTSILQKESLTKIF